MTRALIVSTLAALTLSGCPMGSVYKGEAKSKPTRYFPTTWAGTAGDPKALSMQTGGNTQPVFSPSSGPVSGPAGGTRRPAKDLGIVAVLPLDVSEAKMDNASRNALEEEIRTVAADLFADAGYTVLTGETTIAVLADNGVEPGKACEASCALQAARELKAKVFLSGSVAKSEGEFIAFVRVFEAATGRQLGSVKLEGETVKSLRKSFEAQAPAMLDKALSRM